MVSVNKGSWDKLSESGASIEEKHKFNKKWIRLCKKVLKPNDTIWISGTLHNIYSIGMTLEQEGFKIINNIERNLRFWNYWSRSYTIWTEVYRNRCKRRIFGDI